jgi:hypothetical protein
MRASRLGIVMMAAALLVGMTGPAAAQASSSARTPAGTGVIGQGLNTAVGQGVIGQGVTRTPGNSVFRLREGSGTGLLNSRLSPSERRRIENRREFQDRSAFGTGFSEGQHIHRLESAGPLIRH